MVRHEPALMRFFGVLLFLLGIHGSPVAWAGEAPFSFENAELKTVIEKASELNGLAFLYDSTQVKGKISLHLPQNRHSADLLLKLPILLPVLQTRPRC